MPNDTRKSVFRTLHIGVMGKASKLAPAQIVPLNGISKKMAKRKGKGPVMKISNKPYQIVTPIMQPKTFWVAS